MNRGFALTIGLLAALAPAMAQAQTNIDQGKSASQSFRQRLRRMPQIRRVRCAKGKSAAAVAEFLREHYTTGRDQAASLAAYVAGGRDTVASPRRARSRRPSVLKNRPRRKARPLTPSRDGRARRRQAEGRSDPQRIDFMNPIARPEPPQRTGEPRRAIAARSRHACGGAARTCRGCPRAGQRSAPEPARPSRRRSSGGHPSFRADAHRRRAGWKPRPANPATPVPRDNIPD